MRSLMTIAIVLFAVVAQAEEVGTKVPVKQGFETMNMKDLQAPADVKTKDKVNVSIGCTDATGRTFKTSDAGYESCLMQTRSRTGESGDKSTSTTHLRFGN